MSVTYLCMLYTVFIRRTHTPNFSSLCTHGRFSALFTREITTLTSYLLSRLESAFQVRKFLLKGVYSKRKEFAPHGRPFFRREIKQI